MKAKRFADDAQDFCNSPQRRHRRRTDAVRHPAPRGADGIERAGRDAKILAKVDGKGVMVRQNNVLGTSFHPELTSDLRVHRYFADMVLATQSKS